MANLSRAYSENVQGNFFVDDTCIDCDLCRQIAPSVFQDEGDHSAVYHQPGSPSETQRAAMALVACPTGSIGTHEKLDIRAAAASYPERIDENVYFCGYASPNSYGAASYMITRPEGNVLVDCPRYAKTLVRRIEEMGGISLILFSHRDDVADHRKFHEHFGCPRIIHRADADGIETEQVLDGQEPVALDKDLLVIPVPGHTRGHVVLLYKNKFLFTGDHLAWSDNRGGLIAFRDVAWYSWPEQTKSMKRLLDYEFEWVLPGHGRRAHQPRDVMRRKLIDCISWMEKTH
ncbi:MAG TPA: MBL fold metallo-hydrolase [Terriglobia bacterium]|jgi:glyoxylase-like metal-dependent hydrolase (beta-lactamase superfamily II)/ferredoxin